MAPKSHRVKAKEMNNKHPKSKPIPSTSYRVRNFLATKLQVHGTHYNRHDWDEICEKELFKLFDKLEDLVENNNNSKRNFSIRLNTKTIEVTGTYPRAAGPLSYRQHHSGDEKSLFCDNMADVYSVSIMTSAPWVGYIRKTGLRTYELRTIIMTCNTSKWRLFQLIRNGIPPRAGDEKTSSKASYEIKEQPDNRINNKTVDESLGESFEQIVVKTMTEISAYTGVVGAAADESVDKHNDNACDQTASKTPARSPSKDCKKSNVQIVDYILIDSDLEDVDVIQVLPPISQRDHPVYEIEEE